MRYICTKCGTSFVNRYTAANCHPNVAPEGSLEAAEAAFARAKEDPCAQASVDHIHAILAHLRSHNDRIEKIEETINSLTGCLLKTD